ncbi:MAG: AmpG family muropeptide MFS transporter [Gammaproteobacteria bacterium]|jgi:PAT family beta-lactamase induction signal transducer AmpG
MSSRASRVAGSGRARLRRLGVISALGFASGLPFALTDTTLQAWLAVSTVDIETISVFSLLTFPYVLKFLWAPLLDRYAPPVFGRRRGWILASQLATIIVLVGLAGCDPASGVTAIVWLALLLAFASATQDVAIDAYRAEILTTPERGIGAGLSVAGYRIATVVSGAGAFVFADRYGFNAAYAAAAVILTFSMAATLVAREPQAVPGAPRDLRSATIEPLRAFLRREDALAFVALIVLYKLGDAAAGRLGVTFLVRALGFGLSEIGALYKGLGFVASLTGGIVGGLCVIRWGLYRSLLAFAVLQAVTNFGFVALALAGHSLVLLVVVVTLENLSGGMGTAAFVALLMALCDRRYTATQFALLTGLASLGRVFSGPVAGATVEAFGWAPFYIATAVAAVPAILILRRLRASIQRLDERSSLAHAD